MPPPSPPSPAPLPEWEERLLLPLPAGSQLAHLARRQHWLCLQRHFGVFVAVRAVAQPERPPCSPFPRPTGVTEPTGVAEPAGAEEGASCPRLCRLCRRDEGPGSGRTRTLGILTQLPKEPPRAAAGAGHPRAPGCGRPRPPAPCPTPQPPVQRRQRDKEVGVSILSPG